VSYSTGLGAGSLPLSTVKLLLAAIWLESGPPGSTASAATAISDLVSQGSDADGKALAIRLRRSIGGAAMLGRLRRFGFPRCASPLATNCTTLTEDTPDRDWAEAWSLGETRFRASPSALRLFLSACANQGLVGRSRIMSDETARTLLGAMRRTVTSGSAVSIRNSLGALGAIGGKTGTGPGPTTDPPTDGLFAGLIFDRFGRPRYSFTTWARRAGRGGGAHHVGHGRGVAGGAAMIQSHLLRSAPCR
jgi:hypothetical protein